MTSRPAGCPSIWTACRGSAGAALDRLARTPREDGKWKKPPFQIGFPREPASNSEADEAARAPIGTAQSAPGHRNAEPEVKHWRNEGDVREVQALAPTLFDGFGVVLRASTNLTFIDLDDVRDPETGAIAPWALRLITIFDSWTELSVSGAGLHIFCHGQLPGSGFANYLDGDPEQKVEVYSAGRFAYLTGRALAPVRQLAERQRLVTLLAAHVRPVGANATAPPSPMRDDTPIPEGQRNDKLFRIARAFVCHGLRQSARARAARRQSSPLRPGAAGCRRGEAGAPCRTPAGSAPRMKRFDEAATVTDTPQDPRSTWRLYDAADVWTFAPPEFTVDALIPEYGVIWWGGRPSATRVYSLFAPSRSPAAAKHVAGALPVRRRPNDLVRRPRRRRVRGSRTGATTSSRPGPPSPRSAGTIHVSDPPSLRPGGSGARRLVRMRNAASLGATLFGLDTWTALSPWPDPLARQRPSGARRGRRGASAEDIGGRVIVVDHSGKNRGDASPSPRPTSSAPRRSGRRPSTSSCLTSSTAGRRQLEVFIEGKDLETRRFFLTVSPKGTAARNSPTPARSGE